MCAQYYDRLYWYSSTEEVREEVTSKILQCLPYSGPQK